MNATQFKSEVGIVKDRPLHFYDNDEYEHLKTLSLEAYETASEDFAGYFPARLDFEWSAPLADGLRAYMEDAYVHEIIQRQAKKGDVVGFFTQDDAIAATQSQDEYDMLTENIRDFLSYNGSFAYNYETPETFFARDILYVYDEHQLFRLENIIPENVTEKLFHVKGETLMAVHCPLQEVW